MIRFRSLGCEVSASAAAAGPARELFAERDRRFNRSVDGSELNRVNARPRGVMLVSDDFAAILDVALEAARQTGGLVTPVAGATRVPPFDGMSLRGRLLARPEEVVLDLDGVARGCTVDDAVAAAGEGWVCAGGDTATTVPLTVGLPLGGAVTLHSGGLATSSVEPRTGPSACSPWWEVSVVATSCLVAGVAARAGLLLGAAGPAWLDARSLAGRFVDGRGGVEANETWRSELDERMAA